jgi:hypothetical protein
MPSNRNRHEQRAARQLVNIELDITYAHAIRIVREHKEHSNLIADCILCELSKDGTY